MPDAVCAAPSERLPWLPNAAPTPGAKRPRSHAPVAVSAAAALAIAAGGWAMLDRATAPPAPEAVSAQTVALPPPEAAWRVQAEPQGPTVAEREALTPAAAPAAPKRAKKSATRTPVSAKALPPAAAKAAYDARAWRSGVPGRIIQLGAFRTSAQAHGEWNRVYYRYPLLRPLPPRVIRSKIRGRTYYRLQLGTFSQAHSELLCQRLRTLGEGCMVLGLRGRRA